MEKLQENTCFMDYAYLRCAFSTHYITRSNDLIADIIVCRWPNMSNYRGMSTMHALSMMYAFHMQILVSVLY